jgi:hypothetical protein
MLLSDAPMPIYDIFALGWVAIRCYSPLARPLPKASQNARGNKNTIKVRTKRLSPKV